MAAARRPRSTRRVLSVASECAPLLKTGGLADVVGALPAHPWVHFAGHATREHADLVVDTGQ